MDYRGLIRMTVCDATDLSASQVEGTHQLGCMRTMETEAMPAAPRTLDATCGCIQEGVQPDFVSTQMLASVRMAEWEMTQKSELLTEVHCKTSLP